MRIVESFSVRSINGKIMELTVYQHEKEGVGLGKFIMTDDGRRVEPLDKVDHPDRFVVFGTNEQLIRL